MTTYTILPATEAHARDLAPRLRAADRAEIEAATGHAPEAALLESLDRSLEARVALLDGRPIAIWGMGTHSMMFGPGVPWMVGSDELAGAGTRFLRESRAAIGWMLARYGRLVNWVDARNAPAIRYLGWLGFTFDEPAPWGVRGMAFHRFHMERAR